MKVANSEGDGYYEVSRSSCTCPDFVYRRAVRGEVCKHIAKAYFNVPENLEQPKEPAKVPEKILQYFKCGVPTYVALTELGEDVVNKLVSNYTIAKVWMNQKDTFVLL